MVWLEMSSNGLQCIQGRSVRTLLLDRRDAEICATARYICEPLPFRQSTSNTCTAINVSYVFSPSIQAIKVLSKRLRAWDAMFREIADDVTDVCLRLQFLITSASS